jgi:photosystem II stability/assembly factor-like uncharacterized protein
MTRTLLLFAAMASAQAAPRWELSYFYDKDRETLNIVDLCWASAERGVAAGILTGHDEDARGMSAVTSDGGRTWSLAPLKDTPRSLFFLNENRGWMVTGKGLWQTEEAGRSWRKISSPKDVLRVHFLDENHGFAVGLRKSVWETRDGGKRWTKVAAADEPKANRDYTVYSNVVFFTKEAGIITGYNRPPRRGDETDLPSWVDPERAARRAEWPNTSIILQTQNGGAKWQSSTSSLFGRITRVRFDSTGRILALVEFSEAFAYPSEVYYWSWKGGKTARIFREKDRAVSDVFAAASGSAYLAATAVQGRVNLPVAGPLKVLKSDDLATWQEMEVDYRATARRATFASAGGNGLWVATDTGMILKLVE